MDWQQHFSNMGASSMGAEPAAAPKWYDPRHWTLGEWGSVASIIGIMLWLNDQRKNCVPIKEVARKRVKARKR
jgi:hypothetical protein